MTTRAATTMCRVWLIRNVVFPGGCLHFLLPSHSDHDTSTTKMRRALTTAAAARALAGSSRLAPAQRVRPAVAAARLSAQAQVRCHSHAAPAPVVAPPVSAENTYDIVIIGGGPAGLALANALGELYPSHSS